MKIKLLISFLLLARFSSAQIYQGVHYFNFEKEATYPFKKDTIVYLDGKGVSFVSPQKPYSTLYEAWKPAEIMYKPFYFTVKINCKAKTQGRYSLVIATYLQDSTLFYTDKVFTINEAQGWQTITDSVLFPDNYSPATIFKAFVFNYENADTLYIDDFYVYYTEHKQPNYLLDFSSANADYNYKPIFKNPFYQLCIDTLLGGISFKDTSGKTLLNQPQLVFQLADTAQHYITFSDNKFFFIERKTIKNTTLFSFYNKNKIAESNLNIQVTSNHPHVEVTLETRFLTNGNLWRTALLFQYTDTLKWVLSEEGKQDTLPYIKNQYWLGKHGGITIGNNNRTIISLHNTSLSSTQLDTEKKWLVYNVDYALDHPMLHMPLLEEEKNIKQDISAYQFKQGETITGKLYLSLGKQYDYIPFINPHYSNYKATFIFTEHADWPLLETHRAAYFGSERVKKASLAIGGFVKYKLPVTKSVFYHNPYKQEPKQVTTDVRLQKKYASIKENKLYFKFLKELYSLGNEIGLHTPEDKTTNEQWLNEALQFMQKEFSSTVWIDHGYDNAPFSNREDLACDGGIKNTPNYSIPYWEKYHFKNFWNPYFEDISINEKTDYNVSLVKPYSGIAQSMPRVYLSKHPNYPKLNQFYTYCLFEATKYEYWDYLMSEQRLLDLIAEQGTFIAHVYPVSIHHNYGFWQFNQKNEIVINPNFNAALQRLANKRDKGLINVCTINNWINDKENKNAIIYLFQSDGIYLVNHTQKNLENIGIVFPNKSITKYTFEPDKPIKPTP